MGLGQLGIRDVERHSFLLARFEKQSPLPRGSLTSPGLDGALGKCLAWIGNDFVPIDFHRPAKTAAGATGSNGAIKREQCGACRTVGLVAVRTVQLLRQRQYRFVLDVHPGTTLALRKSRFEGFGKSSALGWLRHGAVTDHVYDSGLNASFGPELTGTNGFEIASLAPHMNASVAIRKQTFSDAYESLRVGHVQRIGDFEFAPRIGSQDQIRGLLGCVPPHRFAAAITMQDGS
jgi:hypothetical protein